MYAIRRVNPRICYESYLDRIQYPEKRDIYTDTVVQLDESSTSHFFLDFLTRRIPRELEVSSACCPFLYSLCNRGLIPLNRVLQFIFSYFFFLYSSV
jgi:hypothetical protein